mgnify:FL=1
MLHFTDLSCKKLVKVIRNALKTTADGIDEQLRKLQKEFLKKANNKAAYDEIAAQIFKLREQREDCTVDTATRDAQIARLHQKTASLAKLFLFSKNL